MFKVAALYNFVLVDNPDEVKENVRKLCSQNFVTGSLIIAKEGINGTIAAVETKLTACIEKLVQWLLVNPLEIKYSWSCKQPFYRMRITIKDEIVTMGVSSINPSNIVHTKKLNSTDWNKLLSDENTVVIDTRNDYEVKIGTFQKAINPNTKTFREFPSFVDNNMDSICNKNIAIFCTGGIRCEKAAAYLESRGIYNVYNLQGGILKYLEEVAPDDSLWNGECFVFDQRISVVHGLQQGSCQLCRSCRMPLNPIERESPQFVDGVSCSYCFHHLTEEKFKAAQERCLQMKLAEQRSEKHLGYVYPGHQLHKA